MSWRIGVYENTLKMDAAVAEMLIEEADKNGHSLYYDEEDGLSLDYDAMEHMDFFWDTWPMEVLNHPSVNGVVAFISADGDDSGRVWGYEFKDGRRTELVADITLKPVK